MALCALHAKLQVRQKVDVLTTKGVRLTAKIIFSRFEQHKVDIAVLKLDEGCFKHFIPVHEQKVSLLAQFYVVGMKGDESVLFAAPSTVNTVRPKCAILEASYCSCLGLSGAAVVAVIEDQQLRVLGVHVGAHEDDPVVMDKVDPAKANEVVDNTSLSQALTSFSGASHGRTAYTMICDVGRVPGLVAFLKKHSNASSLKATSNASLKATSKRTATTSSASSSKRSRKSETAK